MKAVLVYQAGIANVFEVDCLCLSAHGRAKTKRLMQADFRSCENFANGLGTAGVCVRIAACNRAGDIIDADWDTRPDDAPFSDKFNYREWN